MNKEEFAIDEKTYENQDGFKIKIIFSSLGRRYKKLGENLYLMVEKETVSLEDSLTAMVRITKENEEIDRKKEIEIIKQQAKLEIQQIEETKNDKIIALEKELATLKELYATKQKERELETKLKNEIEKFKEKLQIEEKEEPDIRIDDINKDHINEDHSDQSSDISETYTEMLANLEDKKSTEINTGDIKDTKASTPGVKKPQRSKSQLLYG